MAETPPEPASFAASLRRLGDTLLSLTQKRLELATLELAEEKQRLLAVLLLGGVLLTLGLITVLVLTAALVVVLWDVAGKTILLGLAVLYLAAAGAVALTLRNKLKTWPPPLSTTIGELKKDREWLRENQ